MNEIQSAHNVGRGREKRVVTGGIVKGSFRRPAPAPCLCRGVGFMAVQLVKSYLYICVWSVFYTTLILGINSFLEDKTSVRKALKFSYIHEFLFPPCQSFTCSDDSSHMHLVLSAEFIHLPIPYRQCLLYPGDGTSASGVTALRRPGPGPCVVLRG